MKAAVLVTCISNGFVRVGRASMSHFPFVHLDAELRAPELEKHTHTVANHTGKVKDRFLFLRNTGEIFCLEVSSLLQHEDQDNRHIM